MGNEMARDGTRLALFIDGANAHATAKALGFDIDYKRLLTEGTAQRAFVELQERGFIDCMTKGAFSRKVLHATE
jgi:uncharacterized LabA/DUF88 family protein